MPVTGAHLPAIVALHGAETPMRDDALFRHLTEKLPATGMAVPIFDRCGSGASSGNARSLGFDSLTDDAVAGDRAESASLLRRAGELAEASRQSLRPTPVPESFRASDRHSNRLRARTEFGRIQSRKTR